MELGSILAQLAYKSLSAAERDKADAYAGPDKSFPLYKNGEHLAAAWDLAGHADNPSEVRSRILSFAREHGLTYHLPADATRPSDVAKKALLVGLVAKARTEDMQALAETAWRHAQFDGYHKAELAHFAKRHNIMHLLPAEAHSTMHDEGIVHEHDGMQNDEHGHHSHEVAKDMVKKAFTSLEVVTKAWTDGSGQVIVEGWVSTPDKDLQNEVTLPEAFLDAADDYASRGMPLSSEHNTKKYPVGHGQRVAVVKGGQILKSVTHPSDPAEFEHFPGSGDGVYGRFAITESEAAGAVYKGNVRSFSYIALPVETEPLPAGGRVLKRFQPWLESTIAAYPVNGKAVMTAAA